MRCIGNRKVPFETLSCIPPDYFFIPGITEVKIDIIILLYYKKIVNQLFFSKKYNKSLLFQHFLMFHVFIDQMIPCNVINLKWKNTSSSNESYNTNFVVPFSVEIMLLFF